MRHIFGLTSLLAAAIVCAVSCRQNTPEGVLTRQEMVRIMEELYLAEEKVNHLGLSRDSAKRVFAVMGEKVFRKAAVNDTVFSKSLDYYMEHPRDLELIYTALVDTLQLREQRAPFRLEHQ